MSFSDFHGTTSSSQGYRGTLDNRSIASTVVPPITNAGRRTSTPGEYEELMREIGRKMQQYQQQMMAVERLGANTRAPTASSESELQAKVDATLRLQGEIAAQLSTPPPEKYRTQHKKKMWLSIERMRSSTYQDLDTTSDQDVISAEEIQFRKLDNDISHHEALIRERNQELTEIHKSIVEVNGLFKDVAHLVQSQEEQIDTIENYVADARDRTAQGLQHVREAAENQRTCLIQ